MPLGIHHDDLQQIRSNAGARPKTIGYLARLAPEKGLHVLVEAFLRLKQHEHHQDTTLAIAGWLGKQHQSYARNQFQRLDAAGFGSHYRYWGTVDRAEKLQLLGSLDVLSVPATYRDPKGLYVLEAWAAGVPVIQPQHGAFPELLNASGAGLLCRPDDPEHLSQQLLRLLDDPEQTYRMGRQGRDHIMKHRTAEQMARATLAVYQQLCPARQC